MLCHPPPGTDCQAVQPTVGGNSLRSLGRDTAVLLSDLTQGASNWIQSFLDPSHTSGARRSLQSTPRRSQQHVESSAAVASCEGHLEYPEGFAPLRSECLAFVSPTSCPIIRNPFVSPLLAPTELLRGLPPVYIVVGEGGQGLNFQYQFWLQIINQDIAQNAGFKSVFSLFSTGVLYLIVLILMPAIHSFLSVRLALKKAFVNHAAELCILQEGPHSL